MMDVRKLVAVFDTEHVAAFTIDMVQLTVRPLGLPVGMAVPPRPTPAVLGALEAAGAVKWEGGDQVTHFESGGLSGRLVLGTKGVVAASFQGNVHRRIRAALVEAGAYRGARARDREQDDNFIDPAQLAWPLDLHVEAWRSLWALIGESQAIYRAKFEEVFGAPAEKLSVTLTQVELTWDRPTAIAKAAPTLWWPSWRDSFPGAARIHEATSRRDAEAARGAGVLRADYVKGGGAKLYAKTERLLRFEAELTRERMGDLLGRPLRLDSAETMRADLEALATRPYGYLLDAQRALTSPHVIDLPEVFDLFSRAGTPAKVLPIFRAFWSGARFHNEAERHSRELTRLRKAGAAKYVGHGLWAPGPVVARTFHVAQVLARHAEAA